MAPCSLSSLEGLDNVMQNGGLVDHSFCALETFQWMSDFPQSGVILHMYRLYLYMNRTLPWPSFAKMSVFDGFWTCGLFNVAQAGGHRSHKLAVNHSQLHILFWKLSCCSLSVCQIIVIYSRSFHLPVLRLVKFGNPVKNKTVTCKPALVWLDDPECRLRDIHADHKSPRAMNLCASDAERILTYFRWKWSNKSSFMCDISKGVIALMLRWIWVQIGGVFLW